MKHPFGLPAAILGLAALQAAGLALFLPVGSRLRPFVDLLAGEGLLLAILGSVLVADRPFLAARAMARRLRAQDHAVGADREEPSRPSRDRSFGVLALLLGASMFGASALLWAAFD